MQAKESIAKENPSPVILFSETKQTSDEDKENFVSNDDSQKGDQVISVDKSAFFLKLRDAELNRLRAARSPERRCRVEKTQAAIHSASSEIQKTLKTPASKFQTLNACRKAKKAVILDKSKQTKSVRFQWDEEKIEAKRFYSKVEENRRQLLALQRQLASSHFQEKARKQEADRLQHIAELDKESQFNSEVFREHQQTLKEARDRDRKKSMDARAKLRVYRKAGEEKMEAIKQEEEAIIFEVRSDLYRARHEAKLAEAQRRRKSFQFRTGDAKRIRQMRSEWLSEEQMKSQQSYELGRAAARDVDAYKKQLKNERRESLLNRTRDARRRKKKEQDDAIARLKEEHASYEMKWAGEKDAESFYEKMREERRKSLAARNKESFRHAQVMQELRSLNLEKETESFMLKFAAENDAKIYLKNLEEERRRSLQQRGSEKRRQRNYDDEQRHKSVSEAVQEGMLQSECKLPRRCVDYVAIPLKITLPTLPSKPCFDTGQKDVQNFRKEMAMKARKSLQFRGKESVMRRLDEENQRKKLLSKEHQSFELDSLARLDVDEYLKECKKRRRKSLAFRAKENRRHAEWKKRQHEEEIQKRQEAGHLQALDYQYMALAEQQERARIAMNALRAAGCRIKGNPFGELLGNL
jgi:hypothetical protein